MRMLFVLLSLSVTVALFFGCESKVKKPETIEGIWKSIGYGKYVVIDSSQYSYYDVTSLSCIPIKQGKLETVKDEMKLVNDTLTIGKGYTVYRYTRASSLPSSCDESTTDLNDPLYNFEVYAATYKKHYAYFELNKLNWDSLYLNAKNKINATTSEAELYLILDALQENLNDNHGAIEPTDEIYELVEKLQPEPETEAELEVREYGDFEIASLVANHFLDEDMTQDSWLVKWGK